MLRHKIKSKKTAINSTKNEVNKTVVNDYELSQNYPNPFNPTTIINYQLVNSEFVSLKVYDELGKVVTTLVNDQQTAGSYQVNFDGTKLASGIYYYEFKSGNFLQVKKMMLLK